VRNNIRTYKERFAEKAENGGQTLVSAFNFGDNAPGLLGSANYLQRRQANPIRSSSGVVTASPKVFGSSLNILGSSNN